MKAAIAWADAGSGVLARAALRLLAPQADPLAGELSGRAEGLGEIYRRIPDFPGLAEALDETLAAANQALSGLPVAGFPAVVAATLARRSRNPRLEAPLMRRLRLIRAVVLGRL